MKKAIFAIYAASVLLFSGLARAEADMFLPHDTFGTEQKALINSVSPDLDTLALQITGTVANPNTETPVPVLFQDQNNPQILTIVLQTKTFDGISILPVKSFNIPVSLPHLIAKSNIIFDERADYLVRVDGSNFEIIVNGSDLIRYFPLPQPNQPATF